MSDKRFDEMTPAEARAEWIKDLRSGVYAQIRGNLHAAGGGYCCLGVGCETYKRCGGRLSEGLLAGEFVSYDGFVALLPPNIGEWLGLNDTVGDPEGLAGEFGDGRSLVSLNDSGASFAEIADLIEQDKLLTC